MGSDRQREVAGRLVEVIRRCATPASRAACGCSLAAAPCARSAASWARWRQQAAAAGRQAGRDCRPASSLHAAQQAGAAEVEVQRLARAAVERGDLMVRSGTEHQRVDRRINRLERQLVVGEQAVAREGSRLGVSPAALLSELSRAGQGTSVAFGHSRALQTQRRQLHRGAARAPRYLSRRRRFDSPAPAGKIPCFRTGTLSPF